MSRIKGVREIHHAVIENKEELIDFCKLDNDLSGANGEECTLDEALEEGFNNSAEYIVNKAEKIYGNSSIGKLTEESLNIICKIYEEYDKFVIIEHDNACVVMLAELEYM